MANVIIFLAVLQFCKPCLNTGHLFRLLCVGQGIGLFLDYCPLLDQSAAQPLIPGTVSDTHLLAELVVASFGDAVTEDGKEFLGCANEGSGEVLVGPVGLPNLGQSGPQLRQFLCRPRLRHERLPLVKALRLALAQRLTPRLRPGLVLQERCVGADGRSVRFKVRLGLRAECCGCGSSFALRRRDGRRVVNEHQARLTDQDRCPVAQFVPGYALAADERPVAATKVDDEPLPALALEATVLARGMLITDGYIGRIATATSPRFVAQRVFPVAGLLTDNQLRHAGFLRY